MNTGIAGKPARTFHIRFTERIYRLHLGGIMNHAPRGGGIFELVEFPPDAEDGKVLYVGHIPQGGSIAEHLQAIVENRGGLPPEKLEAVHARMANLYFDAVLSADCESEADWQDLAWALVHAKTPPLNDPLSQPKSGRYSDIGFEDLSS
ncbi:MAG TPA: hypothetical protein VK914_02570 [bacterium]|jgi:hypothetical protein|nr:hypothetical protein [bacterium]